MARQGRSVRLGELDLRRTVGIRELNSMILDDHRFHWHSYLHSRYSELAFQPRSSRSKLFIYPLTFFGEPTLSSAPSAAPYWELRSPINSTGEDDRSDAFRFLLPLSLPFYFWSALSILTASIVFGRFLFMVFSQSFVISLCCNLLNLFVRPPSALQSTEIGSCMNFHFNQRVSCNPARQIHLWLQSRDYHKKECSWRAQYSIPFILPNQSSSQ